MPVELKDRSYRLVVGTTEVTGLACEFNVAKSLKPEPNTCTIKIRGLSDKTIDSISNPKKKVPCLLEAGYGQQTSQIFLGELRSATHVQEGADVISTLTSGDGEKAIQKARLNIQIGARTPPATALQRVAEALKKEGLGLGNVAAVAAKLAAKGYVIFPTSTVLSGSAAQIMTDLCRSAGLEWSIQDGKLQLFDLGQALDEKPLILDGTSGLIGSPSVDADGVINAKVLMIPNVRPGLRVQLNARFVHGIYRIKHATYNGATHAEDWTIDLACDPWPKKKAS